MFPFANPANLWNRYYYGLKPDDLDLTKHENAVRFLKAKLNPFWKVAEQVIITNRRENGEFIANRLDPINVQLIDTLKFITTRWIRVLQHTAARHDFDAQDKMNTAQALKQATVTIMDKVFRFTTYTYLRDPSFLQWFKQADYFTSEANQYLEIDFERMAGMSNQQADAHLKKWESRLTTYLTKLMGYYEKGPGE